MVVAFQPAVRAVVNRVAVNRHVVGVHHPMHKAYSLPVNHHVERPHGDGLQELNIASFVGLKIWEMMTNGVVSQRSQVFRVRARSENLKVAESNKAGSNPANNGTWLIGRISVVHHVTHHLIARGDQRKRTSRGDSQVKHGFTAKMFSEG